jgi:hypothetical protein
MHSIKRDENFYFCVYLQLPRLDTDYLLRAQHPRVRHQLAKCLDEEAVVRNVVQITLKTRYRGCCVSITLLRPYLII